MTFVGESSEEMEEDNVTVFANEVGGQGGEEGGSGIAFTVSQGGKDGLPPLREKRMEGRGSVRGTIFRGYARWGLKGGRRAVREPPLRSVREVRMDYRLRRPLHNRHSGTRAGIQGWEFRIEPHVYSAQHGLSLVVMQRSPFAGKRMGGDP